MNAFTLNITILILLISFVKESEPPVTNLPKPTTIKSFHIVENDSVQYDLNLAFDSLNQPLYYFRNIFTPVCYTNKCHPVYINFYWDLLGNFIEYDFPPKKILTKVDHDPFQEEDYQKLLEILLNKNSLLKAYKMEELVDTQTMNNGVDAVTGATLKTIKNEVIEGAVYTCYTLWHIANGEVNAEIPKITEGLMSRNLLSRFFESENHYYHYYAVEKAFGNPESTQLFTTQIFQKLTGDNIFLSKYILEQFPENLLSESTVQQQLTSGYQQAKYPLQIEMLKKFASMEFSQEALKTLTIHNEFENYQLFQLKSKVFSAQKTLPKEVTHYLANYLENQDSRIRQLAYETLIKMQPKEKTVQKKMDQYNSNK
ncbi:hypothetical protein [Flexithrix dorotheae]|uniref:hypothetical protein n=1 Tax=Flexithrix dorotheae TaxID=70993 RepID=UPI0007C57099|nr:hypothetical protein [Flexithrix dorotheae]